MKALLEDAKGKAGLLNPPHSRFTGGHPGRGQVLRLLPTLRRQPLRLRRLGPLLGILRRFTLCERRRCSGNEQEPDGERYHALVFHLSHVRRTYRAFPEEDLWVAPSRMSRY